MASAAVAGIKAFGIDRGLPFPLADIPGAEAVLIAGGNPAETMPPIMQYFDAQREAGGKLIVVDPRRSETAKRASLHLQVTPGTDLALAHGMLHVALRDGLIDRDFIEARTAGFEEVRRLVASWWPDRVERVTGVPARLVGQAAHIMGEAASAIVLSGRGAEQQVSGVDNVLGFINLILALGKAGKPHCGYGCLTGQGNGQGGREHGQKADQLPGYRKIEDAADREAVAAVWDMAAADLPRAGKPAVELLAALGGDIKALLVFGSNLVVSAPDNGGVAARLKALDLLVVADLFLSETAALADVVLPVAQWAEEEGTMTNLEGRVLLRRQAKALPDGVRTDTAILAGLAARLGVAGFSAEPAVIFDEMARASAGGAADYGGVSWARVAAGEALFWPCPDASHAGTPRMFQAAFGTADGRARFHAVAYRGPAEAPDAAYPLVLTTGRVLAHYQTGTQTKRVPDLLAAAPEAFAEIHPDTARDIGVADGAMLRLVTRRGEAVLKARYSRDIRFDTVFVPFHWAAANVLTNAAVDPVSRIPEFKVCAARAEIFATGV
jgi:assimilatory nitrate reductase catalytic subunit